MGNMCCSYEDEYIEETGTDRTPAKYTQSQMSAPGGELLLRPSQLSTVNSMMRGAMSQVNDQAEHFATSPHVMQPKVSMEQARRYSVMQAQTNCRLARHSIASPHQIDNEMTASTTLSADYAQQRIRRAKSEGSTVTIRNGALYIDYKYEGLMPEEQLDIY